MKNFVAFILTHGRPDRVHTYGTLRKLGYTGKIVLVVDDLDDSKNEYIKKYGDEVIVFDKKAASEMFDQADNFDDMRTIVYARNACFKIAKDLGIKYFIQLDDDYTSFDWRFDNNFNYIHRTIRGKCLDRLFSVLLEFYKSTPVHSVAFAQGGDYIGGAGSGVCFGKGMVGLKRKCMNSFICSTDREFRFIGRINEDVNTYTNFASKGLVFFTVNQVNLEQLATQSNQGGMTSIYLDSGTYIKSFYTVMFQPSSVKIRLMGFTNNRLHHSVDWRKTTPMILSESIKKTENICDKHK